LLCKALHNKGKIENVIKYVKYNFLSVRDFDCLEEARESLARWLKRRGNGKISQATKRIPRLALKDEQPHLRSLKNSIFRKHSLLGREVRMVSDKSFITVDAVEYSVPTEYRNRQVEIFKTQTEIFVFDLKDGTQIAAHRLCPLAGRKISRREHFRRTESRLEDLYRQTLAMYEFPAWKEYVNLNNKAYPRYTRDQFVYAAKHLKDVEDVSILENAVCYCLENKTYSMPQLKDTYEYQLREHMEEQEVVHNLFSGLPRKLLYPVPEVARRSVGDYESLVNPPRGGAQ